MCDNNNNVTSVWSEHPPPANATTEDDTTKNDTSPTIFLQETMQWREMWRKKKGCGRKFNINTIIIIPHLQSHLLISSHSYSSLSPWSSNTRHAEEGCNLIGFNRYTRGGSLRGLCIETRDGWIRQAMMMEGRGVVRTIMWAWYC